MGGGVRKKRNAIGKAKTCNVFTLNIMRVSPAVNRDKEIMWYSSG